MSGWRILTVAAAATAMVAGCGGAAEGDVRRSHVRAPVAERLAGLAEDVAARLDAGDDCSALERARRLEDEVGRAIEGGRVPSALRPELTATVRELLATIRCEPAEPAPPAVRVRDGGDARRQPGGGEEDAVGQDDDDVRPAAAGRRQGVADGKAKGSANGKAKGKGRAKAGGGRGRGGGEG